MALINCDFYSEALGLSTSMKVILPEEGRQDPKQGFRAMDKKYPTLYLLHGLSDDHTIWLRRTNIERYVSNRGIAVVMPAVHRSFYTDMAKGLKYWTFVSQELVAKARTFFPLSDKREDNFVAGLSMGGYGAFKLALSQPEAFAAAASLSGAVDVESIALKNTANVELDLIFGGIDGIRGTKNDLFYLADSLAGSKGPKPRLYQCCGTEDFLYEDNIKFRDYIKELGLDLTYEEGPGSHEWGYWDMMIQRVLDWLTR